MIVTTVMCCFSLFIVLCDNVRQMERSIWIMKVPREEEQLGGAAKETTAGVARQVAALICRKRASRDKRRTTSTCFSIIADIACRLTLHSSRYSRGGKEKKAAKRNTSESSRDVSDFDPRKNRQPAPGDLSLLASRVFMPASHIS